MPGPVHSPAMGWERRNAAAVRQGAGNRRAAGVIGLGAVAAVWAGGCSSLQSIDREVDRLVQGTSSSINAPVAPSRTFGPEESFRRPGQADTNPETYNPLAEDLLFPTASPDRDVAARLEEYAAIPADGVRMDLRTAFATAQASAREYRTAEEEYLLAAIRLLIERHRWGPRFFDDLTASLDGSLDSDSDVAASLINELRVTQRLPYGGQVEAALITSATEQLRSTVTEDYRQSAALVINADIPLLRNAGLIAREDLIQAERDVVYAARMFERFRREFFVDIARDFLGLVAQLSQIANQERSLQSRLQSFERARARVEAGRDSPSEARRLEGDVLVAQSSLINQRENYLLALDRFKLRLGIDVLTPVLIEPSSIVLPEPDATPLEAAQLALVYRLDLQNQRDFVDDSRRAVANAYNQLLPDLDVFAVTTTGDPDDQDGFDLRFDETDYRLGVTFGLPLDREIERLNVRSAIIGLERAGRAYEQFRDNVIIDARSARRRIDQERNNLRLADQAVETAELRLEELKIKEAIANDISEAEDALVDARNERDATFRNLRIAVLDYLVATGQLRVDKGGMILPLPGMVFPPPREMDYRDAAPGAPGSDQGVPPPIAGD